MSPLQTINFLRYKDASYSFLYPKNLIENLAHGRFLVNVEMNEVFKWRTMLWVADLIAIQNPFSPSHHQATVTIGHSSGQ